ncbi:MAG: metallophosphoesterase [Caldimicrobium sp.]
MTYFVIIFLFIYFLVYLYLYLKILKPIKKPSKLKKLLIVVALLGYVGLFIWKYFEAKGNLRLSYLFGLFSLLWMGYVFYLFFLSLFFELWNITNKVLSKFFKRDFLFTVEGSLFFITVLSLSLAFSLYSYYETLKLKVERFVVNTDKLPQHHPRIKILHISDVHLGPIMGLDKIALIKEVYDREKPDIIVSTGDLVDGNMENREFLAKALAEMNPPFGKYAVLGNHEYYRGLRKALEFTKKAGFQVLMDDIFYIKDLNISLVGVEDDTCKFFNLCQGNSSDIKLLARANKNSFLIYLKHQPKLEEEAWKHFNLMLSGHTHGGLYYPIGKLFISLFYIADRGLLKKENALLYISKGVGTGGPPMRFLSPPDIAIIELVRDPQFR